MKHRKITIIPILSMIFIGFFLTMNINLLAPRSSISKTLNSSASGDVWFSSVPTQTVGDTFETNIYVDTGSQILGAYGFEIAYNDAVIQIVNSNDVVAGAQGFVSAVNIDNNNGVVTIAGFDAMGTGPGSQLHLLTLTWTAIGTGTSSLDLSIMDLADNMLDPIGTATDIDGNVEVEGGPVQAPVLNSPSTVYYQENTIGHSITWIATDDNPTTFIVTRLNVPQEVVASGSWSSGVGITVSIDGLSDGYWVYNCTVYDEDGLFDTSFVNVRVTPTAVGDVWFSSVSKQTIGNTFETKIYVNTGSQNLGIYGFQIAYNESVIQIASNDDIVAGPRGFVSSINVDNANGLVTIIGIDALGIAPMVELHLFTITWTAVGLGTSSLDLTIDALSDIESLDIGTPNAIDGSVEVRGPMSAPVLSYPLAFYYRENTIGHSITWIATDDNPTTYTVTRMLYPDNQTLTQVSSGSYSSGSPIIVNVDGLSVGVYQYTCTVNDADGLSNSNIVMVRVIPADLGNVWFSPVSTQTIGDTFETKIYINTGSQNIAAYGFNITYNKDVIQIASDEYVVAGAEGFVSAVNIDNVNGWVMIAGFEAAGTGPNSQLHLITINWTTVGVGTSSLDLSIEDLVDSNKKPIEFSNAIDDSIVVDPKQAPIIDSPQDFSYKAGETGNSITWIATDNNPTTYIITRNDTQVDSDIWSSGNPITINIDGLSPNIYIYTITVYDGDNLIDSDSITVLVYPANEPEGGNIPGYDLFIFLGSMWITILAMIYIKKRR